MALWKSRKGWCVLLLLGAGLCSPVASAAQEPAEEAPPVEEEGSLRPRLSFGLEARANFRNSDENRFPVNFPFTPDMLPVGQTQAFEETVNPGSHFELSNVALLVDAVWGDGLAAHGKIDFIDLYDRNPTSSDRKVDVDEAWIRFGVEAEPAALPERGGVYLKIGKLPKFERQDDRHLESYGLVSTAFNRMEDTGAELGLNLGRHFYVKLSATQGNPVFIRDPNALAGDSGTPALRQRNPDPELGTGIVILYDAEVEDLDVDGDLESGAGVGWRWADESGRNGLDVLAWGYRRKLAERVELEGTFYGGDLDTLNGAIDARPSLPITDDNKQEIGANIWLYLGGLSFFGQYVDQELAGLPRTGIEGELAWRFELPLVWAVGDRQLFTFLAPAVRYSKLDNDFRGRPGVPTSAPSLTWDWEKIDAGLRLGIFSGVDVTVEYQDNRFVLGNGSKRENNELLTTLRWRI